MITTFVVAAVLEVLWQYEIGQIIPGNLTSVNVK